MELTLRKTRFAAACTSLVVLTACSAQPSGRKGPMDRAASPPSQTAAPARPGTAQQAVDAGSVASPAPAGAPPAALPTDGTPFDAAANTSDYAWRSGRSHAERGT